MTGTGRILIEPGAGSAAKVRLILDALRPAAFVPMDISFEHLKSATRELAREYPWLPVHAVCVDYAHSLPIPEQVPEGPRLLFFPGSSLGTFDPDEARDFLVMARNTAQDDGMLLIGVDTKKNETLLNSAYNDAAGMTAEFNLNLLHRMRRELDLDCNLDSFEHQAYYNSDAGRIEMHLVSRRRQELRVNGHRFKLEAGESLHTEFVQIPAGGIYFPRFKQRFPRNQILAGWRWAVRDVSFQILLTMPSSSYFQGDRS